MFLPIVHFSFLDCLKSLFEVHHGFQFWSAFFYLWFFLRSLSITFTVEPSLLMCQILHITNFFHSIRVNCFRFDNSKRHCILSKTFTLLILFWSFHHQSILFRKFKNFSQLLVDCCWVFFPIFLSLLCKIAFEYCLKMTEFLAEDSVCGQNLLQIVAVGNAIIAEILRVKDYIPELYRYVFNWLSNKKNWN